MVICYAYVIIVYLPALDEGMLSERTKRNITIIGDMVCYQISILCVLCENEPWA